MDKERPPAPIGLRVAALRVRARLSARGLSDLAGVSESYVTKLETGEIRNPGAQKLERIATALRWPSAREMLASTALEPPEALTWTPEKLVSLEARQAELHEFLGEIYTVLLGVRRDLRTLLERGRPT